MPADDPQRKTRGGLVEAPEGQPMIHRRHTRQLRKRPTVEEEKRRSLGKAKDPSSRWMNKGSERRWGPLSRSTAWRVGSFWDGMKGNVDVFLEKDGKRGKSKSS